MNKKIVFIFSAVAAIAVLAVGGYSHWQSQQPVAAPESTGEADVQTTKLVFEQYTDTNAGFRFQYPKDSFTIDKNDSDNVNYAHVDFTKTGERAALTIWVQDPPKGKSGKVINDLATWIKEPQFSSASVVDTKLGGQSAKKLMLGAPHNKVIIATFYDGLLYWIEAPSDSQVLRELFDQISGSFEFIPAESSDGSAVAGRAGVESSYSGMDVVEEEVVE